MKVLRCFCNVVDSISEYTAKLIVWAILALMAIFCWEVVLRGLFNKPTIWAHESTQYFFGVYFVLGGAYCLRIGSMVRVDIFIMRFKPRTRAIIEGITGIVALIFLSALIWTGFDIAWDSVVHNERSITPWGPPVYPIKIVTVVGSILLGLQGLAKFIRDIVFGISGTELR